MKAPQDLLGNVIFMEMVGETLVIISCEEKHEELPRVSRGQEGIRDLPPGRYRIRRYLTTEPVIYLGETWLETGARGPVSPRRLAAEFFG